MTAPEFTVDDMIDEVTMVAGFYRGLAGVRIPPGSDDEHGYTRRDRLYRAIAARLSATASDWQPPEESERPDGFRCLGFITGLVDEDDEFVESAKEPEWMIVAWQIMSDRTKFWTCIDGIDRRPTAFAPLPPAPTQR